MANNTSSWAPATRSTRLHWPGSRGLNMTRRELLKTAACVPALFSGASAASTNPLGKRGLGGAPAGFGLRIRANGKANPPVDFVDYCHGLGQIGRAHV